MPNALIDKLSGFDFVTTEDAAALEAVCGLPRNFSARHDLIVEGDKPGPLFVVLEGWACRYKLLGDGTRQIMAFLMPGDFCDMHLSLLDRMDHNIATITSAKVAMISRMRLDRLLETRPNLVKAFLWTQLVDEGVLRAWIVSMGRRDALERVAHLMCELYNRARNIGLAKDDRVQLPLTQIILADALGLTPVHVNRVLGKLRTSGVMSLSEGTLIILDPTKLAVIAGFDANYLHARLSATPPAIRNAGRA